MKIAQSMLLVCSLLLLWGCSGEQEPTVDDAPEAESSAEQSEPEFTEPVVDPEPEAVEEVTEPAQPRPEIYHSFALDVSLDHLDADEQRMVGLLIDAADIMDALFWRQAYGDRDALLSSITDEKTREFARINYGPWDRLAGNRPFVEGFGPKPAGANYYPSDMSAEEFDALENDAKTDLYTLIRRDDEGQLTVVPYHQAYETELARAAELLRQAADLSASEDFANYLRLRAEALVSDDYRPSDMAWLDVRDNNVELIIGAIETYEDQLHGYKAGFEAYVLIKDWSWAERLQRYAQYLPQLQQGLPVDEKYRDQPVGTDSDLNAYDAVYYAGNPNAGSKTIAVNLPNDEQVQAEKGTRRLQIRNSMQAKYDAILEPLADILIVEEQREHITFDAFFANTMFHEVAHGLGVRNTINGSGTVREALREHASPIEEGKADVLGLYMVRELFKQGVVEEGELMDYYVTFLAGIFRSVRFGASSAHGRANMMRFNYFAQAGAFERDDNGRYRVVEERFSQAVDDLSRDILTLQGDGDYDRAGDMLTKLGIIEDTLQGDLDRIDEAGIPVDIRFRQGREVLGL